MKLPPTRLLRPHPSVRMSRSLLALLIVMAGSATSLADDIAPPLVSGFDRFGRHADLDTTTSGRLLITELGCTACHGTEDSSLSPKAGPRLEGAADRLDARWLRQFLAAPQTTKPGTTMPDVLASLPVAEREDAIDALLAFLGTQHKPWPTIKAGGANPVVHRFWDRGDPERGRRLYHTVGCVACHAPDDDYETVETKPSPLDELLDQLDADEIAELGLAAAVRPVNPVPHSDLPRKYSRQSLTYFLLNPEQTRPAGRMPSLKLEPAEAADIAAWLLVDQSEPVAPPSSSDEALAKRGQQLFSQLGCANCHSAKDSVARTAKELAALDHTSERSCLRDPSIGLPHYPLDESQRATVLEVLTDGFESPASTKNDVQLRMLQLNCYGCHERNGHGGVGRNLRPYFETAGHVDIGDEGRIPPLLTGVGHKLETAWIKSVLQGKGDIRPHMLARMPIFPSRAVGTLPDLLATADREGEAPAEPTGKKRPRTSGGSAGASPSQEQLADAGRLLMDVGCVQCHGFRGEALPGVVGVDLGDVTQRIRPTWFREFLLNPSELKPRTRMPSFFPGGKSQNPDVLHGDPGRQIDAMWAYLAAGDTQPLPAKIEDIRRQDFELKPTNRPIVLRTFMPVAGTHAIAVGLPDGVHFAFDSHRLRLAQAWRGRFLDAQGTWFSRFAPPAEPLGDDIVTFPRGPLLAWLETADASWPSDGASPTRNRFRGFRLDADGVPTFLYEMGAASVADRIAADGDRGLTRRLEIAFTDVERPAGATLWLRAHAGASLNVTDSQCVAPDGLTVSLDDVAAALRQMDKHAEWVAPIQSDGQPVVVELRYQW